MLFNYASVGLNKLPLVNKNKKQQRQQKCSVYDCPVYIRRSFRIAFSGRLIKNKCATIHVIYDTGLAHLFRRIRSY